MCLEGWKWNEPWQSVWALRRGDGPWRADQSEPSSPSRGLSPLNYLHTIWFPDSRHAAEGTKLVVTQLNVSMAPLFLSMTGFCFSRTFSRLPLHPFSVARIQRCKSMHHFSPAPRFDIHKGLLWNSLFTCSLAWTSLMSDCSLFLAQRGWICKTNAAACVSESNVTKPYCSNQAYRLEKCNIMRTSNQSKQKLQKDLG